MMILPILTLTIAFSTALSFEYDFIYPPLNKTQILRHRIEDPNYLQDLYDDSSQCKRNVTCVPLKNATCFGTLLPYDSTTLDLIPGHPTQSLIRQRLHMLKGLKFIPKCWSVVRPFLCSLFMPKCVNGTVELPSQNMCHMVFNSCRLILNQTIWPKFIKCDDDKLFQPMCLYNSRVKFNRTWTCPAPLVPTNNTLAIFDGIDGCGVPCKNPLYTHEEHEQIRKFIGWGASSCCLLNLFAVITFLIDWRSSNKFPASVIFYINGCFMLCCFGWLVQFAADSSNVTICKLDGTLRRNEPSGDLSCVLIFIMVYYPLVAAMVWFVILTYTWHLSSQHYSNVNNRLDKKSAYFHLLAWCVPLMLTVGVMGMSEVDGDGITGICFVSRYNHVMRMGFVLGPVAGAMLIGGYFLVRGLTRLISLTISSEGIVTDKASSKLRDTIVRMGLFSAAIVVAVVITIYCHSYDFRNSAEWNKSFRDFMICSITTHYTELSTCKMESRPSVTKLQLHLFALFFTGIVMSSWVWTSSSLGIWLRFVKRLFNREVDDPVKLKKHEVIAQAYSKRKIMDENGRLSITYRNEDPVGLTFDPNSVTSQDFSATWAAALPHLVERRGALIGSIASTRRNSVDSRYSNRRSSNDSRYSFSLRKVSYASRRNSGDSQFAVSINEVTAHGQLPYCNVDLANKRRKTKVKDNKYRSVRGYKVTKNARYRGSRTARGYVHNSQDTPAIDTD